ncbi:hypothetical protein ES288_A13G156100v1 [Gossypium darwinii]|nr:hypothetical protein ES288_A13G156100v1 [Gossypium darwinii]TYH92104.1 hypothetical protein ES332_A13G159100v1 [Gossypium tomentosum]
MGFLGCNSCFHSPNSTEFVNEVPKGLKCRSCWSGLLGNTLSQMFLLGVNTSVAVQVFMLFVLLNDTFFQRRPYCIF